MNRHRLGFLIVTLALSINAPAFAHDMAETEERDGHDMAPNAMGGQMGMGAHMVMTSSRPQAPNDIERARDLINTLRRVLARYHDSRVALSEGYRIFLPTVPQEVYHFTDDRAASQEYSGHFDPARPGSLLYVKNSGGDYVLVGAMYSAPATTRPISSTCWFRSAWRTGTLTRTSACPTESRSTTSCAAISARRISTCRA